MKPNYELLKDAYAIIDGIPDSIVDLRLVVSSRGKSPECGTVCCAAGWLAHHPQFQALGLGFVDDHFGDHLTINGQRYDGTYADQMGALFNLDGNVALRMFAARTATESSGSWLRLTDKQVFLRRVREFLQDEGQL